MVGKRLKMLAALVGLVGVFGCLTGRALATGEGVSGLEGVSPVSEQVPLVPALNGGLVQQAEREAELASPRAVQERLRSRTEFEGYRSEAAISLAKRLFGVGVPAWTGPENEDAGKITSFLGEYGAVVQNPDGGHQLAESNFPLRSTVGSGKLAPVSLKLKAHGSSYEPANPLVPLSISASPEGGVSFAYDVRVAPSQHEAPEASQLVGGSVYYPGVSRDTDFLLEPVPDGVEASWQLLSEESGKVHGLTFALPQGASLVLSKSLPGAAEVLVEGGRVLLIRPSVAIQADGVSLPVSYSVNGDTLSAHVDLSGSIDFPVMVDPQITQEYGGGSRFWAGWELAGTADATYWGGGGNEGVAAVVEEHGPAGWAAESITAPGASSGEGSVTRVDVRGFEHKFNAQSTIEVGITSLPGKPVASDPVWTYNGTGGAMGESPLITDEEFSGREATFCAQSGGGYDGGPEPLCNPSVGDEYFHISVSEDHSNEWTQWVEINQTWADFIDTSTVTAGVAEGATTGKGNTNVLASSKPWLSAHQGGVEYYATDPAFGVADMYLQVLKGSAWETVAANDYETEGGCDGIVCAPERRRELTYENLKGYVEDGVIAEGENRIRVEAVDPSGIASYSAEHVMRVDTATPHDITIAGESEPDEDMIEITEGVHTGELSVKATDGEGSTVSSGIAAIKLEVDEHAISAGSAGKCSPGPCSATATWTLNGAELGAGVLTLRVTAEDSAGNIDTSEEYTLIIDAASPIAMGPGSVNPESGDFALGSTDVDLNGGASSLVVSRHYDSRNVTEGEEGPLGPQWTISLGNLSSLEELENGNIIVTGSTGPIVFTAEPARAAGYAVKPLFHSKRSASSPTTIYEPALANATETLVKSGSEFILEDAAKGTTTVFTHQGSSLKWLPTISTGAVATDEITDTYQTVDIGGKEIVEPTEELAPHSSTLECPPELAKMQRGCRALLFSYGPTTTATGEAESQWGNYEGDLTSVSIAAWNPASDKMEERSVAQYAYDAQGRLRAEWDPRVAPALKTIYGYDTGGQVVAVTPPGQQPWLMTYGTIAGDAQTGRLIKITRSSASHALWAGQLPKDTEAPKLSGSLIEGTRLSVTNGTWANEPDTYAYTWERCRSNGCTVIEGATNANYTLTAADVGYSIKAIVGAINSGGTASVGVTHGGSVKSNGTITNGEAREPAQGEAIEYDVPVQGTGAPYAMGANEVEAWDQKDIPREATAVFPEEHPQGWPASSYTGATVYYMDAQANSVNVALPSGGISTTEYNETDDVTRTLSAANLARALETADPREAAEQLDTQSTYDDEGGELTETLGAEHQVKLADGETMQARQHTRNYYDEGAPEVESEPEQLGLVTRTTSGALLSNGEEKDVHTTLTGYSGQDGLGWELRQPTSVTVDPRGADLVSTTAYDKATGDVIETRAPGGNAETVYGDEAEAPFGEFGSGAGQLNKPEAVAVAPNGDVWIADTVNDRIEKFTAAGAFIGAYGTSGEGALDKPVGLAINQTTGNVYVADTEDDRIVEFSESGAYLAQWGKAGTEEGEFESPVSVAVDGAGRVWVGDYGNDRIEEFSESAAFIRTVGSSGSEEGEFEGVGGLTFSDGDLYAADPGGGRVEEFSLDGRFLSQFGGTGEGEGEGELDHPWGIAVAATTGNLYVASEWGSFISEYSPAGKLLTEFGHRGEAGDATLRNPTGLAVGATGELLVADTGNDRITRWSPPGAGGSEMRYLRQFGSRGIEDGQFEWPSGIAVDPEGGVWVSDAEGDHLQKFSRNGDLVATYGGEGSGPGQFEVALGVAINPSTSDVYVADYGGDRIEELNPGGEFLRSFGKPGSAPGDLDNPEGVAVDAEGDVWVADQSNNRIDEFSSTGAFIASYGSAGTGHLQFKDPEGLVVANGEIYVTDRNNGRIQELSLSGEYLGEFGGEGGEDGQLWGPEAITADAAGNLYVTEVTGQVQEFSPNGHFLSKFASEGSSEGQLEGPEGIATNAAGDVYVVDATQNRVEEWAPRRQAVHDTKVIYYSAGAEAGVPACEDRPEWEGLTCRTEPAAQPEDTEEGMPLIPVTTVEYNIYDQPEATIEAFGSTTRTRTTTYDEADRPETTSVTLAGASEDKPLPSTNYKYSATTGALSEQSSEGAGSISRAYNTLGELTEYVDAAGNHTTYAYDEYGRLHEANYDATELDGLDDTETYTYAEATGQLKEVRASGVGAFGFSYDPEGHRTSETYPNGMTASYAYNSIGEATSLRYLKTSGDCSGSQCEWFNDSRVPSINGETATQESSLAKLAYAYNEVDELTEVQETPTGEGCTTSVYGYDEEGERTSLRTRKPTETGGCASEGGSIEQHTYDESNRLTDEGVQYEAMGNITKLPAADAGGEEPSAIETEYYATGQAAVQRQDKIANGYQLDPEGRTMTTTTTSEELESATTIAHYAAPGQEAPAWAYDETSGAWTRNIVGFEGLVAVQEEGKQPELQLSDLGGNIIGTASLEEAASEPATLERATTYGVPVSSKPADKYSWDGAAGLSAELPSGAIVQDGITYVPLLAAPLQTENPVIPAADNIVMPYQIPVKPFVPAVYEQVGGGGGIDPDGILTGEEALEFAHELENEWVNLEQWLGSEEICSTDHSLEPAACELVYENAIEADKAMQLRLEECGTEVHKPESVSHDGTKYTVTGVCFVHFYYGNLDDRIVIEPGGAQVSACYSQPWTSHGKHAWYCSADATWWKFGNRGWWRNIY